MSVRPFNTDLDTHCRSSARNRTDNLVCLRLCYKLQSLGQIKTDSRIVCFQTSSPILGGQHSISRGGWSFCRGQIIYFNRARRRAENFTF